VSSTELAVPAANLTGGFSFQSGVVVDYDDFHSVTLTYTDGNESLSVVTRTEPITSFDHSGSDRYETVTIGDTTGYLFTSGDFLTLYVEGDQPYTVRGEIDEQTGIDVAEALLDA